MANQRGITLTSRPPVSIPFLGPTCVLFPPTQLPRNPAPAPHFDQQAAHAVRHKDERPLPHARRLQLPHHALHRRLQRQALALQSRTGQNGVQGNAQGQERSLAQPQRATVASRGKLSPCARGGDAARRARAKRNSFDDGYRKPGERGGAKTAAVPLCLARAESTNACAEGICARRRRRRPELQWAQP